MAKPTDNQRSRRLRPSTKASGEPLLTGWSVLDWPLWSGLVAAVFFSRFFLPAEAAAQGDTLWIVALWFACGIAWSAILVWRASPRLRFDWLDGAVAIWIGSQLASALLVILTAGEKRMAANMAWEWLALGVIWIVLHHGIVWPTVRHALLRATVVTGVVLAGYGLYQHYVEHPQLVAEYGPLFDRLKTATGDEADSIKRKLAQNSVPTEGPAQILFEKRLRDSREPLGLFALANTFGGTLAACLMLALSELLAVWRRRAGLGELVIWIGAVALIGWCLLLTKSRTAWIGSACGVLCLLLPQLRFASSYRRFLVPGALVTLAIVGGTTLLFMLGGLDRQVLSEAPKSVAYRLQYWQATGRLIADHPWLGVGPGNFRQHYLKYKLPQASEEIADPHNLFFDVAATGGIISLVGLALFLTLSVVKVWKPPQDPDLTHPARDSSSSSDAAPLASTQALRIPVTFPFCMAAFGIALAFFGLLICWGQWEDRLVVLAIAWCLTGWLFAPRGASASAGAAHLSMTVRTGAFAAAVALVVHLLGAGGISMPGVTQLLLLLVAFSLVPRSTVGSEVDARRPRDSAWPGMILGLVNAGMLAGVLLTALAPVVRCRSLLERGTAAGWSGRPDGRQIALEDFRAAATADPWSPDPWRHQFEWSGGDSFRSNDSLEAAVMQLQQAMSRDPVNFWAPRTLGNLWLNQWQVTRRPEDAGPAVVWLDRAHQLYPTNSAVMAELATALLANQEQEKAAAIARAALRQDDIYHQQGHLDRYLGEARRHQLDTLAEIVPIGSTRQK